MRSVGSELLSIALTLAIPVGVAAVFPYRAVGFKAQSESPVKPPFAAFVRLTADEAEKALMAAKMRFKYDDRDDVVKMRINMFDGNVPEIELQSVLDASARMALPQPSPVEYKLRGYLPSSAADDEPKIKSDSNNADMTFSRMELLEIK